MNDQILLLPIQKVHWSDVKRIYQEGIDTGIATLETEAPEWTQWHQAHVQSCRFVALINDMIVGWSALSPVSGRCVYQGVAEVSVYVSVRAQRTGVGYALLSHLVHESEMNGFWTLQAGIYVKNVASIRLHRKCGFREVGIRERIGKDKHGDWWDVMLMERRSPNVGI